MSSDTCEWSNLFPLKTTLFSKSKKPDKKPHHAEHNRLRRGSSMSDLDKLGALHVNHDDTNSLNASGAAIPELVRSSTTANKLCTSLTSKGYDSVPQSPALSRNFLCNTGSCNVRGSIGDLMNQKKFGGSSWSVRSETLIAKTVPLSTVTCRYSPPSPLQHEEIIRHEIIKERITELERSPDEVDVPSVVKGSPLTAAQRTQRLSRLIKQQRTSFIIKAAIINPVRQFSNSNSMCQLSSDSNGHKIC